MSGRKSMVDATTGTVRSTAVDADEEITFWPGMIVVTTAPVMATTSAGDSVLLATRSIGVVKHVSGKLLSDIRVTVLMQRRGGIPQLEHVFPCSLET